MSDTSYGAVPGFISEKTAYGETTVIVERERLLDAARHLRDLEGFNFLSDIAAADYLDWGRAGVAGYWGSTAGRDVNSPGSWGFQQTPEPKPKRFSVSYHLLAIPGPSGGGADQGRGGGRVRLQVWCDDEEPVASVVPLWPTADWHEREAYDLMGIVFEGHPNLTRILLEEDWEGHPLRKDYPIGGEPVRFSEAE